MISVSAAPGEPGWVEVKGERETRADPQTGRQTHAYRPLSPDRRFGLAAGKTFEKTIHLEAKKAGYQYVHIAVQGDNFPVLTDYIAVQISRPGTPRTEDERISRLFDRGRIDRMIFTTLPDEGMYRWEGGKLYSGDCTLIPVYGPSCQREMKPSDVVYVIPDSSKHSAGLIGFTRLYTRLFSADKKIKTAASQATAGMIKDILGFGISATIEGIQMLDDNADSVNVSKLANFMLGPLIHTNDMLDGLRDQYMALKDFKSYFPDADYGYIHHKRKVEGEWEETYSLAFFVQDPGSGVYYVFVVHEALQ